MVNRLPMDLFVGPVEPVIQAGIDSLVREPTRLRPREFTQLVSFVRDALLDRRVLDFCHLIPHRVPSGSQVAQFEGCDVP